MRLLILYLKHYHKKFSIGDYRFDFIHSIGTWYIPLSIHFGSFGGEWDWTECGIGFLSLYLEWSHKDSLWAKVLWETD
jgi:hypothetical protein